MNTRLAKLEEAIDGLKRVQGYTFNILAIVVALVLGVAGIVFSRTAQLETKIGNVETKIDDLPGKINGNLLGITNTLSSAITAARAPVPNSASANPNGRQSKP